jgi:hypothetical protein
VLGLSDGQKGDRFRGCLPSRGVGNGGRGFSSLNATGVGDTGRDNGVAATPVIIGVSPLPVAIPPRDVPDDRDGDDQHRDDRHDGNAHACP